MRYRWPAMRSYSDTLIALLHDSGIEVGRDLVVHDPDVYRRILGEGSLGLGESYMDGAGDSDDLAELIAKICRADLEARVKKSWQTIAQAARARVSNMQSIHRSKRVAEIHYDLGNDMYGRMLDDRMAYTCGYFGDGAQTLGQAQEAKLDLICRKLGFEPGMRVLELGSGWGSFAGYAAEKYGVEVVAYNISTEQIAYARDRYADLPIDFRQSDYRTAEGQFDRLVSIGMLEHVGPKNHRSFFEVAKRCLNDDGIGLVHFISGNDAQASIDPWLDKYIFPGATVPSLGETTTAMHGLLVVEDVHNFGPDYDRTLMMWLENFESAWPDLKDRYDERFRRMWRYYLCFCAGGLRARHIQLQQVAFTPIGRPQPQVRLS